MGHHESRYILPVMVLLIIYLGALLVSYFQDKNIKNRLITVSIIIFISFSFLYNTFIDIMSSRILLQGHKEEKLIREIKQIQTKEPSSKTLLVKYYLLGAPHTKDAYWDYMNKTNKTKVNLYNELLKTPLPEGIASLSVEYSIPIYFKLNKEIIKKYNHIIYYYEIAPEQKPEPDYFDVNALNLLYHKSLSDSYFLLNKKRH